MDGIQTVESEVRELIRRQRLDPMTEAGQLRGLVGDVIRDYEERSLHGGMAPLGDAGDATQAVLNAVVGFGPLQTYLDDPTIEEIWINDPARVFVARSGVAELTSTILTSDQVKNLVERMLKPSGRRIDLSSPFVDASLPDGSRLHVAIPDVTRADWYVNIRKFVARAHQLDDLVRLGTLTHSAARFLSAAVSSGLNILVAGGTQAGKTTMLNCLAAAIPSNERVVSCEEVFELRLGIRDWAAMQCRQPSLEGTGEIPLRRLVKEALRMRPSRIIVGEVRQEESLDLLIALNSGLTGIVNTPCDGRQWSHEQAGRNLRANIPGPRGCRSRRRTAGKGLSRAGRSARLGRRWRVCGQRHIGLLWQGPARLPRHDCCRRGWQG